MIYYDDDKAYYKTHACKYTLWNISKCYEIDICSRVLFSYLKVIFLENWYYNFVALNLDFAK